MANINASSSLYTDNIHQNISSKCVTCKFGCFSTNSLTKLVFIILGSKIITSGQYSLSCMDKPVKLLKNLSFEIFQKL